MSIFGRVLALALIWLLPQMAIAQTSLTGAAENEAQISIPENLQPEDVAEIVSRLSDAEVRAILLERLDAVAAQNDASAASEDQALQSLFEDATVGATNSMLRSFQSFPRLISGQSESFRNFYNLLGWSGIVSFVGLLIAAFIAGYAVERAVVYLANRRFDLDRFHETSSNDSLRDVMIFLICRLMSEAMGLIAFYMVARAVLVGFSDDALEPLMLGVLISLVVVPRVIITTARFFLSPRKPMFRLVYADQWTAEFLMRHIAGFAALIGFTSWILSFRACSG